MVRIPSSPKIVVMVTLIAYCLLQDHQVLLSEAAQPLFLQRLAIQCTVDPLVQLYTGLQNISRPPAPQCLSSLQPPALLQKGKLAHIG